MRKSSIVELDGKALYVTVATDEPRSEHMVPLAELLSGEAPAPAQPVPAVDVEAAVAEAVARVTARIDALEAAPAKVEPTPIPIADMPKFMRDMAAQSQSTTVTGPSIDDAIAAVNDIESRMMGAFEQLARRVDEIATRLDMAPMAVDPQDHSSAIETLTTWLRSIEERATTAGNLAAGVASAQHELERKMAAVPTAAPAAPVVDPPKVTAPVMEPRQAAAISVRDAARRKRESVIGASADERDVQQRLVEVALNARSTREHAIRHMEMLAAPMGVQWDDVAREFVAGHDRYTSLVVATAVIEAEAARSLSVARPDEFDGIVRTALAALERVGV